MPIPTISRERALKFVRDVAQDPNLVPPEYVIDAVIAAYQRGRYDEACDETRALALA